MHLLRQVRQRLRAGSDLPEVREDYPPRTRNRKERRPRAGNPEKEESRPRRLGHRDRGAGVRGGLVQFH